MTGIRIAIDTTQARWVARAILKLRSVVRPSAETRLRWLAGEQLGYVIALSPRRTGKLARSFSIKGRGMKFEIESDAPHAPFVVRGTRPHPIFPRRKKALWWPGLAHPVARVSHPGTKPNPFLDRAVDEAIGAGLYDRAGELILQDIEKTIIR